MKKFLFAGLAICAMSTAAFAEPQKMSETEMQEVTAGLLNLAAVIPTNAVLANAATAASIGLLSKDVDADAAAATSIHEVIAVDQSKGGFPHGFKF